ncbi:MAG: hypothetical protein VB108_08290 [Anaerolineaceae bacterium]|nr:hypothetical protein [Anaerolineaceae bacterium]
MTQNDISLLEALCAAPGLPGREAALKELIAQNAPKSSEAVYSAKGDILLHLPGTGKRLLFLAHLDEVGLIVRRIHPAGFLLVERLGGVAVHCLPGHKLDLWTKAGRLDARCGAKASHLMNGRKEFFGLEELYVEIGASSAEEAKKMGVRVGDGLTWPVNFCRVGENLVSSKALDDRLGCFALLSLAQKLSQNPQPYDLYFGFTTQEEANMLEAMPLVEMARPDLIIGVDGALSFDTPDEMEPYCDIALGKGPCLKYYETVRGKNSFSPDWETTNRIAQFLESNGLPFQAEVVSGMLTAVCMLQNLRGGTPTLAFSIPIRYHHSPVETTDLRDTEKLIQILTKLISKELL